MRSTGHSHINSTWDSGPSDTSTWGVNYNQTATKGLETVSKPPLPVSSHFLISAFHLNVGLMTLRLQPRPHNQALDQPVSPESNMPASRVSATTIDVPLFLQPIAYDPASAPPLPGSRRPLPQDVQSSMLSPHEPGRLPPPPPQKIPLGHVDTLHAMRLIPQRPSHDLQHSYGDGQQKNSQIPQRPRFDPQDSHNAENRPSQRHSHEQRPTIPVPHFTSFDVESALPPEPQPEVSLAPQQTLPESKTAAQNVDLTRFESGNKSSISLADPSTAGHLVPSSSRGPQAACISSSEQQYAVFSPPNGQSDSTTDLSINTAGVSTPASHQTSSTSYREDENLERTEQQGDDSFYWHSGRSSSDADEDQGQSGSPTATPRGDSLGQRSSATISMGLQREHQDLPIRSTSLSPTTSATYGASALGFGGPSDWEYFGDYEAEEIDDEELYSRPRLRDTKSMVDGSTELPVDLPLDSITPGNNEPDLPGSDSMRPGAQSLPGTCSSRPFREVSSQGNFVQDLVIPDQGDSENDIKPPAVYGSVAPHPVSIHATSSSDTYSQQRSDLDDVIRAWSEAPYVGKVHEVIPAAAVLSDKDKVPAGVTEASLASTPRESFLGVDVILKGSHMLPKLPDTVASPNPDKRGPQRKTNMSAAPPHAISTATNAQQQNQPMINKREQATHAMLANAEVKPSKDPSYNSETAVSSGHSPSTYTDSSITKISSEVNSLRDRFIDSSAHGFPQASPENTWTDSDGKARGSSQINNLAPVKQMAQEMVEEHLRSERQENRNTTVDEAKSKLSLTLEGSPSHKAITEVTSKTIRCLSQETSMSESVMASTDIVLENFAPRIPCNTSEEHLKARDSFKPERDHSEEDVKTPITYAISDKSLSKDNPTSAPARETLPPSTSSTSLPHQTPSMELGAVKDPYSDLDLWSKASLNRFAAMLREETRAETNQDKLSIFNVFTSRESRLRVVLYGTDDELIITQKPGRQINKTLTKPGEGGFVKQAVERANSIGLERSLKALPALPINRESVTVVPGKAPSPSVIQHGSTKGVKLEYGFLGDDSNSKEEREIPRGPSADDSYIMVEPPTDEVEYSPSGRPVVARFRGRETDIKSSQDARSAFENGSTTSSKTPGNSRRADSSRSNGPIVVGLEGLGASEEPACTPLKHNEGHSEVKNYLANRKSVCRPYATLTQGALESASTFGKEEDVKIAGAASIISSPTNQPNSLSQAKVDSSIGTNKHEASRAEEGPTDLRRFAKADFDPLLLALPRSDAVVHVSARILDLRNVMEAVPDDFSFIHQSVVAWDAKAKKRREDNDRQRHARQANSEQKIDLLFDDHEIGYGDIAELELEFKRSEAARKADEDRFEYQTFVSDVFSLVWTRLHYELDQLIPHYDQYSKLMDHTLAGKDMFEGSNEGLALGPTMSSFLALFSKLEIRHQKAFEAVLERDRRLKKTEISPWYTLNNIAKVKHLEKQFEDAEKKAIIEYCLQRDARANHLMDVLDQNTLRGVGANQDYMEAIMKAVRRTASGRAFASVPDTNEPTAGLEEVEKAKAITALLASSSEQVVQTFHVADMLLNSADYEVSVAKAKVAKADMATLAKLKEERAKEDQKLMRDLEHRLALIREDTRRTNDEIVKLMLFLGVQNEGASSAPSQAASTDPQHGARIQKALEEAKRRNALKESEG